MKNLLDNLNILRDPQPILSKFLSSLELEYEKQIMDFYLKNRTENREPSDLLGWKLKTLDPIDSGNMNKFKKSSGSWADSMKEHINLL